MGVKEALFDYWRHFLTKGANMLPVRIYSEVQVRACRLSPVFCEGWQLPEAAGTPL